MFSKQNSECENCHCHWQQSWVWLQSVKVESSVHDRLLSHISTEERARRYSETRSRSKVSGAYTCWKTLIKLTFSTERLYPLTEGWYRNISLLPVPRTDSLNCLAEALVTMMNVNCNCTLSQERKYEHSEPFVVNSMRNYTFVNYIPGLFYLRSRIR